MNYSVHIDDLSTTMNATSYKTINNDSSKVYGASTSIQGFMSDTTVLKGDQWNRVRNKMGEYNALLNERGEVAGFISEKIAEAIQLLADYLGEDEWLDMSKLDEMKERKRRCEKEIASLEASIDSKKTVYYTNALGKTVSRQEYVYSASERASMRTKINTLREELQELNRLIEKTEGLKEVYEQAMQIVKVALAEAQRYNQSVNSITPSKQVQFKA